MPAQYLKQVVLNMKKILALLAGCCIAMSAQADKKLCGYTDFFHFNDSARPLLFISSSNTNGNIYLHPIGARSFELKDTEQCRSGRANIVITDYANPNYGCMVDIEDGPFMNHPTVSASCNGVVFSGISYDGFNSYSYTLNFK